MGKKNKGEKKGQGNWGKEGAPSSFPVPLRRPTSPFFLFHKLPLPPSPLYAPATQASTTSSDLTTLQDTYHSIVIKKVIRACSDGTTSLHADEHFCTNQTYNLITIATCKMKNVIAF